MKKKLKLKKRDFKRARKKQEHEVEKSKALPSLCNDPSFDLDYFFCHKYWDVRRVAHVMWAEGLLNLSPWGIRDDRQAKGKWEYSEADQSLYRLELGLIQDRIASGELKPKEINGTMHLCREDLMRLVKKESEDSPFSHLSFLESLAIPQPEVRNERLSEEEEMLSTKPLEKLDRSLLQLREIGNIRALLQVVCRAYACIELVRRKAEADKLRSEVVKQLREGKLDLSDHQGKVGQEWIEGAIKDLFPEQKAGARPKNIHSNIKKRPLNRGTES